MTRLARLALITERTSSHRVISISHRSGICQHSFSLTHRLLTHLPCFPPSPYSATILSFISCCDITAAPWLPSFPLPGPAGNEQPRWIAGNRGGSVGGQGHTCVHHIAACVFPLALLLKWGADVGHIKVFAESSCCDGGETFSLAVLCF